jgi:hypothetical protein
MATERCAQILNGVVENIIVADPATFKPGDGSTIVASPTAQIGDTYANGVFTHVVAPVVYQTTGLRFLQFMALFTPTEQAAIVNSTDTQVELFVMMATGAGSIDLLNPEVIAGINYLASANLVASARVATILSGAPPA